MSTAAETIKERLGIVDVIAGYVKLEKSGRQLKARCPFHGEKTPSFYVSPDRNSFHCFGCQASGDIFSFIEKIEGVAFRDALTLLADKAGVDLNQFRKGGPDTDTSLYEVLEAATDFFEGKLQTTAEALHYVRGRAVADETIKSFRIGFAPNEWHALEQYLHTRGIAIGLAEKAGLIVRKDQGGGFYDRFRGRLMFPIMNPSGKVVGFSGRILPQFTEGKEMAKYINSPETELYKKSKVLFGYEKAKRAITEQSGCIVVEGQMDLVMAHQAGTVNTVAVSGTALTFDHLRLMQRFTNTIIFCLDSDKAGLQALKRSAELAYAAQMDVKVIPLIDTKDPADMIRESVGKWHELTEHAVPLITFLLQDIRKDGKSEEYPRRITKDLVPLIRMMTNSIEQAVAVRTIATELKIGEVAVWTQVKQGGAIERPVEAKSAPKEIVERLTILRILLVGAIESNQSTRDELATKMRTIDDMYNTETVVEIPDDIKARYAHEFEFRYGSEDEVRRQKAIDDIMQEYEKELVRIRMNVIMSTLKKEPENVALITEMQKLATRLRTTSRI